jgi:hypothetical protein
MQTHTRSLIPPSGEWGDLKRLLFNPEPHPSPGPYPFQGHFNFKRWADTQRSSRKFKDHVVATILRSFHSHDGPRHLDLTKVTNRPGFQLIANHVKDRC